MTNQSIKCTRCQKLKPVDMWYLVVPTNPLVFAKEPHCFRYGYDIKWHMPQESKRNKQEREDWKQTT
jgi:hypothetical protein